MWVFVNKYPVNVYMGTKFRVLKFRTALYSQVWNVAIFL